MEKNKSLRFTYLIILVTMVVMSLCACVVKDNSDAKNDINNQNNKTTQIKLKLSSGDVSAKVVNEVNADEQNYDLAPKTLDEVKCLTNIYIYMIIV